MKFPITGVTMDDERLAVFETDLGWMSAVWRDETICELTFGHASPQAAVKSIQYYELTPGRPDRFINGVARRLKAFCRRPNDDFLDLKLDVLKFTEFQRQVIDGCRRIRLSETRTYAQLAGDVGRPKAARAVGQVMATNRFPIIVPCHRVVGANGSPGGYSAPDGLNMKRRLLKLEGTEL